MSMRADSQLSHYPVSFPLQPAVHHCVSVPHLGEVLRCISENVGLCLRLWPKKTSGTRGD